MKEKYFNNVDINYGSLNQNQIAELNTKLDNIKNNLPNLFSAINGIASEATEIHGPIAIKFWQKSDINYSKHVKFGASWSKIDRMVNIDLNLDIFDLVDHVIFELHNACNGPLNDNLDIMIARAYAPNLSNEQVKKMAFEIEKLEFLSRTKTQQVKYDYLVKNEAEIIPFLQKFDENYQKILKETQESLNYSFEDHAKLFMDSREIASLHKESYENNIRHTNKLKGIIEKNTKAMEELKKWRLEIEEEQRESKIGIDFLIKKSDIYKNFRNLLENKYDLAYDTNHDKIENNSYSVDIINEHNLNPNNLEASLDKINFARYNEAVGHIDSSIMDLTPEQFDEQQIIGKLQPYVDSIEFISL